MPSPFDGEMRKLPYPLDEAVSIEAETPDAEGTIILPDFPEDVDEKISILFRWSLNEWVGMATAIDVGSDIAFGSTAIRVWWTWSMNMVALCEEIARCIEETEAVREALANWFSDAVDNNTIVQEALQRAFDPGKDGVEIPEEYAQQNQYGSALGCDNDDGWGHIRDGLIERSFARVISVMEQMEATGNDQEMLGEFVNAIPGIGALFDVVPATDWILWFNNVRTWMKDEFIAADTTDLRDEIACELFCLWQVDCSLSLEQIRDYYWTKTTSLVPAWDGAFDSMSSLATALGFLSVTNFGSAVVYALVGSQYGFLTFINNWFGVHINVLANDLALGDPSDDWEVLCDSCIPTYTVTNVGIITECGTGAIETLEVEAGVPFTMNGYLLGGTTYAMALRLPVGNWQITMNSFTGTIVPPADLNQDAYAYWNTSSVLQHVQWNVPGAPDEFGTQDTNQATFSAWCNTETFNAAIFNDAAFSVSWTIEPL